MRIQSVKDIMDVVHLNLQVKYHVQLWCVFVPFLTHRIFLSLLCQLRYDSGKF